MDRNIKLKGICEKLNEDQQIVVGPLIDNIVFMEGRLTELRALPQIRVSRKNPAVQEVTPAGKQYKETMQSYINAIKVIMSALQKADTNAADELLTQLKEFEL